MKRFLAGLAVCAFAVTGAACAQTTTQQTYNSPALFVARDADSTMYLYGTVHVRKPGTPWGGANAQAALAASDEVWTEILMSPEVDAEAQGLVLRYGMAASDRPLSSWLTAEENARLDALLQRLGAPRSAIEPMRPWLAAITLSVLPMYQAGYDPNAGVDRAVDEAGDAAGKRMRALETIEQQIGFLSGFPDEVQKEMLLDAIDETEAGTAVFDALTTAWESGNLDALEDVVIDEMRDEYPELYETIFVQRNNAWMEVLTRELDGAGTDFVAVGAGHMLGEHGLVAQLRARGVTVERAPE